MAMFHFRIKSDKKSDGSKFPLFNTLIIFVVKAFILMIKNVKKLLKISYLLKISNYLLTNLIYYIRPTNLAVFPILLKVSLSPINLLPLLLPSLLKLPMSSSASPAPVWGFCSCRTAGWHCTLGTQALPLSQGLPPGPSDQLRRLLPSGRASLCCLLPTIPPACMFYPCPSATTAFLGPSISLECSSLCRGHLSLFCL